MNKGYFAQIPALCLMATLIFSVHIFGTAQAEEVMITSFTDGTITWSNRVSDAQYRVEWASTLSDDEAWQTNAPVFTLTATSTVTSVAVPMFFRVLWLNPPPVRYMSLNETFPANSTVGIDITGDGRDEFMLEGSIVGTDDWPSTSISHMIYLRSDNIEIAATNLPYGSIIDANLNWMSPSGFGVLIASRESLWGSFTGGLWGGVTNAYLPFRFIETTNYFYGWVNIQEYQYLAEGTEDIWGFNLTCKSAAYQTEANAPITAGQTE